MISFIVPVYNARKYLAPCIESLLAQRTSEPIRIVLVDDGSTDGSWETMLRYARSDERILALKQAHAGQSAARNLGLERMKGDYIAFVDADDCIQEDWCARHLEAIEGVDYVQSGYTRISDSSSSLPQIPKHPFQFTSPCMRLYRCKTIEGMHFTEGMIYEDVLWSVDLWLRGATCRIIPYSGYRYTKNPESTTSRVHPQAQQALYEVLKAKCRKVSIRNKAIIWFTILRLKLHFIKQ